MLSCFWRSGLFLHLLFLVYVLDNLFGRIVKHFGIFQYLTHILERGGKIVTVADALVGNDGKVDVFLFYYLSFTGSINVASGKYTASFSAEALTEAPIRARLTFGFSGQEIGN